MLRAMFAALLLCLASTASARAFRTVSPERTAMIDGVIAGNGLVGIGKQLMAWSMEDADAPIDLIIDSPGGAVYSGTLFINQMEAVRGRGTKIRCLVSGVAASMAFSILLHCDERVSLTNTYLLWHPVRVSGVNSLTAREAAVLSRDMRSLDKWILRDVARYMPELTSAQVKYHFYHESLHYARSLEEIAPSFMEVRDHIPGLAETLADQKLRRSTPPSMFFGRTRFTPGTIVYMQDVD